MKTAKITGQLTDFGLDPLTAHDPLLIFKHVRPGVAGTAILSTKPVEIRPLYNGYFEADLVPAAAIAPAGYYTVTIEWTAPPGRKRHREQFPARLYVPSEGGVLADILRVPPNPALVWTGEEPPRDPSPGSWWQTPAGDIFEWGGTGWNFKNNIRGPAGYNALGAEATDTSIAAFVGQSAGPTRTGEAVTAAISNRLTFVEVERTRQPGDVSDTERFQRALNKAMALGIPEVRARGPVYEFDRRVNIGNLNKLTVQGIGNRLVEMRSANPAGTNIFSIAGGFNEIKIDGFDFIGTAIETPDVPTRARTFAPNPIESAVYMMGDLTLSQSSNSVCRNFTFTNNRVYGTKGLPLWLSGVRGFTLVDNNVFDNCLDVGLLYLESGEFSRNKVYRGQDNGVSVSRGCRNMFVHHNYFENCAYWAIFCGGFLSDEDRTKPAHLGPQNVVISDNIGVGFGNGGVYLGVAPKGITVHDNHISGIRRGPVDIPSDSYGMGFWVGGLSDGGTGYVSWAEDIRIHNNTVIEAPAGGLWINGGTRRLKFHHNTVVNPGSRYKADGKTEILPSDVNWNYGVLNNNAGNSDIEIENNEFLDLRPVPYLNNPVNLKGAGNSTVSGTKARGNRVEQTKMPAQPVDAAGSVTFYAAGSLTRRAAWIYDGTAVALRIYDPAGNLVAEPFRSRISDGALTVAQPMLHAVPIRVPAHTTAERPAVALAEGAMIFDSTLGKPLWRKGSQWVDAAGVTA